MELIRYDAMCSAIAECIAVDEAKDIRDRAQALEAYYAQAGNLEAERQCCNVRLRAERRCGQLLGEMKKNGERASERGDVNQHARVSSDTTPSTLSDLGITRDQSSKFQRIAEIPEQDFEQALSEPAKPTTAGVLRRTKPAAQEDSKPIDPDALWLWGRLRDFERQILRRDSRELLDEVTPAMRIDIKRLAPLVAEYLEQI